MFFPVDSLKRGGRFYLCWVADSWPLRFATITHRQLWSNDIRKLCDDLMEVIKNESGRPSNRFSLRLSSQLMRGLARLYQKKVNILMINVCMMQGNVSRAANRKFHVRENVAMPDYEVSQREQPVLELAQLVVTEAPEDETRIAEMIQNSGNIVANIQDITLKEQTIPEFQLPPNDGFGEENPEQILQLLERTVEMMMIPTDASAAQHSGIDIGPDVTVKSHDLSRPRDLQMERISDYDLTFRKSDGLQRFTGYEKDMPEIPDVPIPEIPVLPEKQLAVEVPEEIPIQQQIVEIPQDIVIEQPTAENPQQIPIEQPIAEAPRESQQIELEELDGTEPIPKRRKLSKKLIIDKDIEISRRVMCARIDQPVELRCKDSSEDIVDIGRVPCSVLMRRAAHAGSAVRDTWAPALARMFQRNLGVAGTLADQREEEGVMRRQQRSRTKSIPLERIEEGRELTVLLERPPPPPEPIPEPTVQVQIAPDHVVPQECNLLRDVTNVLIPLEENLFRDVTNVNLPHDQTRNEEQDISEALTQKIEELGPRTRKRANKSANEISPKKRSIGYKSFIENQENLVPNIAEYEKQLDVPAPEEAVKENIPVNVHEITSPIKEAEKRLPALLQEAGLADIPQQPMEMDPPNFPARVSDSQARVSRRQESERSETPLGSLDRTKVSLGDSEQTTDSRKFIREEWGNEGTMLKIVKLIKTGENVTVESLIAKGPIIPGRKAIIAARCFSSILKLKFHQFIKVTKRPGTLEIENIKLGIRFY